MRRLLLFPLLRKTTTLCCCVVLLLTTRTTTAGWQQHLQKLAPDPTRSYRPNRPPPPPNGDGVDTRRSFLVSSIGAVASFASGLAGGSPSRIAYAATDDSVEAAVQVSAPADASKLFNEGRALESQGNMAAARRLYERVTQIAPRFVYGWSNLGNTLTAFGELPRADEAYTKAIGLCEENLRSYEQQQQQAGFGGGGRCSDLYVLLLNRGAIRLNNGMKKEALDDLERSAALRGRPDAVVLQNLARAEELNGYYTRADRDYTAAIAMTANEVNPFWLRAANVKFQLGDVQGGFDLLKRGACCSIAMVDEDWQQVGDDYIIF